MAGSGSARENLREKGEVGTASVRIAVVWLGEVKRGEKGRAGSDKFGRGTVRLAVARVNGREKSRARNASVRIGMAGVASVRSGHVSSGEKSVAGLETARNGPEWVEKSRIGEG